MSALTPLHENAVQGWSAKEGSTSHRRTRLPRCQCDGIWQSITNGEESQPLGHTKACLAFHLKRRRSTPIECVTQRLGDACLVRDLFDMYQPKRDAGAPQGYYVWPTFAPQSINTADMAPNASAATPAVAVAVPSYQEKAVSMSSAV